MATTSINPEEKVERVLRHMIESHGLRFPATVMGHYVPEFKLEKTGLIGVRMDTRRGVFLFGAITGGMQLLFEVERIKMDLFGAWVDEAFDKLATERCADFARMPDDIMVYANVSQCSSSLNTYVKKVDREVTTA